MLHCFVNTHLRKANLPLQRQSLILLELVLRIITLRHRKGGSGKDRKEKEGGDEKPKKMKGPAEASAELDRMLENK